MKLRAKFFTGIIVSGLLILPGSSLFALTASAEKLGPKACALEIQKALLAPQPEKEAMRDWTVMVFISGKNDLSAAAFADMREMETVGSDDKLAIVVQLGVLTENGKVNRYLVSKGRGSSGGLASQPVDSVTADMGSWSSFSNFAVWAMDKYPAKRYALILWSHGFGWTDLWGGSNSGSELAIGKNDLSMNEIRIGELGRALRQIKARSGKTVDLLGFDACYMAMLSVLTEVKDYAAVTTASADMEPNSGYPYDKILAALKGNPGMDAQGLGRVIVRSYAAAYPGRTQSAILNSSIDGIYTPLNTWCDAMIGSGSASAALAAKADVVASTNYYKAPDAPEHPMSADLTDYVTLVSKNIAPARRGSSAYTQALVSAIKAAVIDTTGPGSGLYEYVPRYVYRPSYDDTKLARMTRWDDFLKWTIKPGMFR